MSTNRLKTAILGLDEGAGPLLEAASQSRYLELVALADKDGTRAGRTAERFGCRAYDDYRQLIVQNAFDCLLVAGPMHQCGQYLKLAIRKKCNIFKLSPLARNFEEAKELVALAESKEVKFAVANPGRFAAGFKECRTFLQQADEPFFMLSAVCFPGNARLPGWRKDPELSGGGVLLYDCYDIIDQLVRLFGIPDQIYAVTANSGVDRQQQMYITEEIALVTMKFSSGLVGTLTASSCAAAESRRKYIKIYGKGKTIKVENNDFTIISCPGNDAGISNSNQDSTAPMKKALDNFALSILMPDKNQLISSGKENLENMALIEAAYLSVRTGFPEQPVRILQMPAPEITDAAQSENQVDMDLTN